MDSGVLGGALSSIGLGLLEGMRGPSWAEEKEAREEARLKAVADRQRLESQTRLADAQALSEARRGDKPKFIETTWALYELDDATGKYVPSFMKPPADPKEVDPKKAFASTVLGSIGTLLGKPDRSTWSAADLQREDVRPLIDLLQERSDIIVVPGWGPLSAEEIRKRVQGSRQPAASGTGATGTSGSTGSTGESSAPAGTGGLGTAGTGPTSTVVTPPASRQPGAQGPPAGTTSGQEQRDMLPMVERAARDYSTWSESDLQRELEQVSSAEADAPSVVNKAKLTALGRVLAGRRRAPQTAPAPAAPGRQSLLEEEPALSPYVATYAQAMASISPRGALQLVNHLTQAAPGSPFARAATQAYEQVHGQPVTLESPASVQGSTVERLTSQPGWGETAVQPRDIEASPTAFLQRVAQPGPGSIPSLGTPPGQEERRAERSDLAHRMARELYGKELGQLSQPEMATLNRELARREAQGKQRYEDELNNTRALQDVRPTDFDRFFFRGSGQQVPGTLPYGPLKALQNDPDVASGVLHLSTDSAKQLTVLKLLEPVLREYSDLIQYAYGVDEQTGQPGPLAQYVRNPFATIGLMYNQAFQADPVLQAKRRAVEGQLQSLVRALGSRGDLNAQELEQATNLIANMDASLGLGFTVGVGLGRRGIGPMVGFKPTISVPDTAATGLKVANELVSQVNQRIGTLLQNPGYAGTPPVVLKAGPSDLSRLSRMTPDELRAVPESALAPLRSVRDLVGNAFTEEQKRVLAVRLRERLRSAAESRDLPTGRPRTPGIPPELQPLWR